MPGTAISCMPFESVTCLFAASDTTLVCQVGCGNISNTRAFQNPILVVAVYKRVLSWNHCAVYPSRISLSRFSFMMRSIPSTTSSYHPCYPLDLLQSFLNNCFLSVSTKIFAREKEGHRPWHLGDLPVFMRQQSNFSLCHKNFQVFL